MKNSMREVFIYSEVLVSSHTSDLEPQMAEQFPNERKVKANFFQVQYVFERNHQYHLTDR